MGNQSSPLPWGVALILLVAYALFNTTGVTSAPSATAPQSFVAPSASPLNPRNEGDLACLDVPPPLRPVCRQLTLARSVSGEIYGNRAPIASATAKLDQPPKSCPVPGKHWECQPWVARAHSHLQGVIAIVPDPEMTRLALYYGRSIDSITLAAERVGYLFDSYWVPWKTPASKTSGGSSGASALVPTGLDQPATLPGALLFREARSAWSPANELSGASYLLVLLVGESNISGLRRDQLAEALYYLRTLTPATDRRIPIIGPSYSGSFASLHKTLREDYNAWPKHSYRIVSGNTTVKGARQQMRDGGIPAVLTAVQRDDESTMNALVKSVDDLGPVAMLSEGDTAFGATDLVQWERQGHARGPRPITRIAFPRGIAQLRDVYPEDTAAKPAAGTVAPAIEQLPLSLRGSPAGSDMPDVFNVKHLTVAQEAQMQNIAGILNRGGVETAFIFASDVLDLTFVTGYLRQACPNLRVIVQDWDLLFLQTTAKWSMEGVWVVTSLLPPPQNLLVPERRTSRVPAYWTPLLAASQFEHASYDAAYTIFSELFRLPCPPDASGALNLAEGCPDEHNRTYVQTERDEQAEHIWLSVVGHKNLWPIRDLDAPVSSTEPRIDQPQPISATPSPADQPQPLTGRLSRLTALLICTVLGLAVIYQGLLFYSLLHPLLNRGRLAAWTAAHAPRPFRSFRWWEVGYEGRVGYHALAGLLLGCMAYVLTSPFAHWRIERLPLAQLDRVGLTLCAFSFVFAVLGALRMLWSGVPSVAKSTTEDVVVQEHEERRIEAYTEASMIHELGGTEHEIAAVVCEENGALSVDGVPGDGELAALPGNNPPSPIEDEFSSKARIPLLAAILTAICAGGFFLYFWRNVLGDHTSLRSHFLGLRALDTFSGVSPALPVFLLGCGFLALAWTQMSRHELFVRVRPDCPVIFPQAACALASAHPAPGPAAVLFFLLLTFTTAWLLFATFQRQSFDGPVFDQLYFGGLSLLWAALTTAAVRLYTIWQPLQGLLQILEREPIRRAFTALPPEFASSPLLPSSRRQDYRIMLTRSLNTLRALADKTQNAVQGNALRAAVQKIQAMVAGYLNAEAQNDPGSTHLFRELQSTLVRQMRSIADGLAPIWAKGMAAREETDAPPKNLPEEACLAEEFIALRFLAVIRYSVSQMWCQMWFLALGFFFAVLSTTAYPFRSQGSIRWMTNLYLALLGIPVLLIILRAERNPILRRLSTNPEGKSGGHLIQLLFRLLILGALPLLGVINSYVPLLGRFLSTWIEPLTAVPK